MRPSLPVSSPCSSFGSSPVIPTIPKRVLNPVPPGSRQPGWADLPVSSAGDAGTFLNMTTEEILTHLDIEGFCIIKELIPPRQIGAVRESIAGHLQTAFAATQKRAAEIRGKGHRLGGAGVQALPGILGLDQSVVPYLTDERILGPVHALFGDFFRIAGAGAIANHPGNERGYWHADWPYNQTNAAHIPAPYADTVVKLSSLWMLTEFTPTTGGTLVIPGSHRARTNPSGGDCFDREAPHPAELQVAAPAGSVMLFDSRLWHCVATNRSDEPRYALNVGFCPWWLNLEPTREGSPDYTAMVVEPDGKPNVTPLIPPEVFAALPEKVKPLLRHWVA